MPQTQFLYGVGDEVLVGILISAVALYLTYQVVAKFVARLAAGDADEDDGGGRVRANQHDCVICFDEATFAIETNCGHVYCGRCIFAYYEISRQSPFATPTCPYCRQRMTMVLAYFSESERNTANVEEVEERRALLTKIRDYNRRFSGQQRSILEQLRDLPVLLRHLWTFLWTTEGLSWLFRVRVFTLFGMAAIYLFSPFDIIPEGAFGLIGLLDDLLIIGIFLIYASNLFRNFVGEEAMG